VPLEKIIEKFETLIRKFSPGVILAPQILMIMTIILFGRVVKSIMRPHFWNGSLLRYFTWGVPSPLDSVVYVPLSKEECREQNIRQLLYIAHSVSQEINLNSCIHSTSTSTRLYNMVAGRMIATPYAEVFEPVRIVGNKATANMLWCNGSNESE